MRLMEYERLVVDEFGAEKAAWILHSHVLERHGQTADELIEQGIDPSVVWEGLCDDFDVPPARRLGVDYGAQN